MTPSISSSLPAAARLAAAVLLLGATGGALAQYKIVGSDGQVTYTDKPPTAAEQRTTNNSAASGGSGGAAGLPYETRQAITRYPVTLYAQKSCAPCDQARTALRGRGVPFSEYSIESNSDATQLKQRFGEMTLPVITIGNQTIRGFRQGDVDSYLDAAGYPKQAKLNGYAWPAAVPLTTPAAQAAHSPAPATVAPSANGPKIDLPQPSKNGIQF